VKLIEFYQTDRFNCNFI